MSKRKIYRILGNTVWLLLIAGVVVLMFTSMQVRETKPCAGVIINIDAVEGKIFIEEKDVRNMLAASVGGNLKSDIHQFDLRKMEERLRKEIWIQDAQLYVDNEAVLHVNIQERVPLARIFDTQGSTFYIDSAGMQLPISRSDRAEVPVFTGLPALNNNNKAMHKQAIAAVLKVVSAMQQDEFWDAQAAQIEYMPGNRFELYPAIGFHTVDLGDTSDMKNKLQRLKLFYQQVMAKQPIDAYSRISVAFKNQIVASKGADSLRSVDAAQALKLFNQLVEQSKNEVNATAIEMTDGQGRIVQEAETGIKTELPATTNNKTPTTNNKPITPKNNDSVKTPKAILSPNNNNN